MAPSFPDGLILKIAQAAGREPHQTGRAGEFVIQCPRSERHSNGDAHPSCRLNPQKNTWYCDPCGQGGGAMDLARELDVDLASLLPPNTGAHKTFAGRPAKGARGRHFDTVGPITPSTQRLFRDV